MEYLEGEKFSDWIETLKGIGSCEKIKIYTLKSVLEDCYRLDQIGLDHGELSNISKHVIVGEIKSSLIDFESSSTKRRPSNVTSITQAFFIGSGISKKSSENLQEFIQRKNHSSTYHHTNKKNLRDNFEKLLKSSKIIMGTAGFEPATTSPPD